MKEKIDVLGEEEYGEGVVECGGGCWSCVRCWVCFGVDDRLSYAH